MRTTKYDYDAFISHAVEDKIPIANELCARLEAAGLKIWYSGNELGVGDSIEKTIEKGLNRSRYGIVIFSPTYLAKNWTIREFYTLLAKEIEEHKVILPVLYNVSLEELREKDLLMADRFAVNADKGLDVVVERLVREIKKSDASVRIRRPWLSKIGLLFALSLLVNVAFLCKSALIPQSSAGEARLQEASFTSSANADYAAVLMGEVQSLLRKVDRCPCIPPSGPTAAEDKAQVRPGNTDATALPGARPKRMTMAVVFQIDVSENSQERQLENNFDRTEPLEGASDQSPFIAVKTSSARGAEAGSCRHTSLFTE